MIFSKAALLTLLLAPSSNTLADKVADKVADKDGVKKEAPKRGIRRSEQRNLVDLGQAVTFPSPCAGLPAGRVPGGTDAVNEGWTTVMVANDDGSSSLQSLAFSFDLYGQTFGDLYVNNNGNLSFDSPYSTFTSTGFPLNGRILVAPFWADVDTRGAGYVWAKAIGSNKYAVAWDNVGYFGSHFDKLNTFQVIISDGLDQSMGVGNNVCFCYTDMQWTTGDVGGSNGFGGTPATVGANKGDGTSFFQIGRFDQPGDAYDGAVGNNDGVDYLDQKSICFDARGGNIPPVATNVPPGGLLELACGASLVDYEIIFLAPENDQSVTVTSTGASSGLTVTASQQTNQATATVNWTPTTAAEVTVTFTATDGFDETVVPVTFASPGPCCTGPTAEIWNPTTNALVGPLVNGESYCLGAYNLRAVLCDTAPLVDMKLYDKSVGGVTLHRQKEYEAPYFLWGDVAGDVQPNKKALPNGLYGFRFTANSVTTEITFTQACT